MLLKSVIVFGYIFIYCACASETPTLQTPEELKVKGEQVQHINDSKPDSIDDIVKNTNNDQNVISKNDHSKKHILMFHPWGTPSHMNQFKPLIRGLLESGNMVTAVFVRESKIIHEYYKEIIVEDG